MALGVEEHIVGLDVAVDDAEGVVEVAERDRELGGVQPRARQREGALLFEAIVEVAARRVVEDKWRQCSDSKA